MSENLSNKTCGDCCGFSESENRCLLLGGRGKTYADNEACRRFSEKKPIPPLTNGDKIIAGGNKALVKFHLLGTCDTCIYYNKEHASHNDICLCPKDKTCADGIEAWLNAPVDCVGKDTDVLTKESEGKNEP